MVRLYGQSRRALYVMFIVLLVVLVPINDTHGWKNDP